MSVGPRHRPSSRWGPGSPGPAGYYRGMNCVIALESKLPRIVPGGTISAGHPAILPVFSIPVVPRVGEELFVQRGSSHYRHRVTSVRYMIDETPRLTGIYVLVSDGEL